MDARHKAQANATPGPSAKTQGETESIGDQSAERALGGASVAAGEVAAEAVRRDALVEADAEQAVVDAQDRVGRAARMAADAAREEATECEFTPWSAKNKRQRPKRQRPKRQKPSWQKPFCRSQRNARH